MSQNAERRGAQGTVGRRRPVPVEPAEPSQAFLAFFRAQYKALVRLVMYAGATYHQADDAVAAAMNDLLRGWEHVGDPFGYTRVAAMHHFIKAKKRDRDRQFLRDLRDSEQTTGSGAADPALTVWEDQQWVDRLLEVLPPTQRVVMASILAGLTPTEIAELLGKTPEAVRQNLRLARRRLRRDQNLAELHDIRSNSSPKKAR